MIKPFGEMKDPDPPLEIRTAERKRCSAQPGPGWKPYMSRSCFSGRRLKSHMPSSAVSWVNPNSRSRIGQSRNSRASNRSMNSFLLNLLKQIGLAAYHDCGAPFNFPADDGCPG